MAVWSWFMPKRHRGLQNGECASMHVDDRAPADVNCRRYRYRVIFRASFGAADTHSLMMYSSGYR